MVAYLPKLLPLSHPPQHYFHMPLARQSSQTNFLKMISDIYYKKAFRKFAENKHIVDKETFRDGECSKYLESKKQW